MTCRHPAYADGHCAEMACPNYFSACSRHAYSGHPDAPCSQDRLRARETVPAAQPAPKRTGGSEALRRLEQRLIPARTTAGQVEAWEAYAKEWLPDYGEPTSPYSQINQGFAAGYDAAMARVRGVLAEVQSDVLREPK